MEPAGDQHIAGIAALDQPLRRDLYRLLSEERWISRDEAADALGVARSVAAFHLDKLVDAGVVEVRFERTSGKSGPGAGRPSKLYRRAGSEVAASVPERSYDLAALMLTTAISDATATGAPVETSLAKPRNPSAATSAPRSTRTTSTRSSRPSRKTATSPSATATTSCCATARSTGWPRPTAHWSAA